MYRLMTVSGPTATPSNNVNLTEVGAGLFTGLHAITRGQPREALLRLMHMVAGSHQQLRTASPIPPINIEISKKRVAERSKIC